MKIGVTSLNDLKIECVKDAYFSLGQKVEVIGYETDSGVGQQPVESEAIEGARNRINDMRRRNSDLDFIVSIENGIFFEEDEWVDRAFIVIYDVSNGYEKSAFSDSVVFPKNYVTVAHALGFDNFTVGSVMSKFGYVVNSSDPHLSISGKSRKRYLEETLFNVLNS